MRVAGLLLLFCSSLEALEPFGGSVALPNGLTIQFGPAGGSALAGGLHARDNRVTRVILDPASGDYYGYVVEAELLDGAAGRYRVRFLTLEAAGVGPEDVAATAKVSNPRVLLRPLVLSQDALPVPTAVGDGQTLEFHTLVNAAGELIGDRLRFVVTRTAKAGAALPAVVADVPETELRVDVEALSSPGHYAARFRLWRRGELVAEPRVEFVAGSTAQFRQGLAAPDPAQGRDLSAEIRLEGGVALAKVEISRAGRLEHRYEVAVPVAR